MWKQWVLILMVAFIFTGCSKEENTAIDYNKYITAGDEYVMFQNVVHENLKWIYRAAYMADFGEDGKDYFRHVQVVKKFQDNDSIVYTLDYSRTWNDYDDLHKDSIITTSVVGSMQNQGDRAYVKLDGFKIADRQFFGGLIYKHKGSADEGGYIIDVSSQELGFSDTLGNTHNLSINQQIRINYYSITEDSLSFQTHTSGRAEGQASNYEQYSAIISDTSLLIDSLACTRIQHGSVSFELSNVNAKEGTYLNFSLTPPDTCNQHYKIHFDREDYVLRRRQ